MMDPFFEAVSLFQRRNYEKCIDRCNLILEKKSTDEAAWVLKMRAMTLRVYIDDLDADDGGLPDSELDTTALADAPRPGTSLRATATATAGTGIAGAPQRGSTANRPRTSTGRPLTGMARLNTMNSRGTADGARSLTAALRSARGPTGSARSLRLGTASALALRDGGPLMAQATRLNVGRYAGDGKIAKPLFEYLYYHEGDTRKAMDLCAQASQRCGFTDWWWKLQLARCYTQLGLHRDAERQLRSSLAQGAPIEAALLLSRIYVKIDQPLSALAVCKAALEKGPREVALLTEQARVLEALDDLSASVIMYRQIMIEDAMNTEALACVAVHHFYNDQPEIALRYYRRILSMGALSAELFNNLALCCLYSRQLDLVLSCFQRALQLSTTTEQRADVWYNLSFVAVSAGDLGLARRCLRLTIGCNAAHAAALNNLAVLEQWSAEPHAATPDGGRLRGRARAYMTSAVALEPHTPEIRHNAAMFHLV